MFKTKIKKFFLVQPIRVTQDIKYHRQRLLFGFLAATIYAIAYGIFEYIVVYTYGRLVPDGIIPEAVNWFFMYIGLLLTVGIATKWDLELMIMGLFYMTMFEDLVFWISLWIDTGNPGFGCVSFFYIMSAIGPKTSRIAVWITSPFFIAVLIGTLWTELFAIIVLAVIPFLLYAYITTVFVLNKKGIIEISTDQENQNENSDISD